LSARGGCLAKLFSSLESTAGVLAFSASTLVLAIGLFLLAVNLVGIWFGFD